MAKIGLCLWQIINKKINTQSCLSLSGTIVRKLPRKLEVLEGENAAFCVEVEADDLEVHWFKDSLKLRETHQTILKSFNQTHVLVFINVAHQDTGVVTFVTGRSKTSCRLKVKGKVQEVLFSYFSYYLSNWHFWYRMEPAAFEYCNNTIYAC